VYIHYSKGFCHGISPVNTLNFNLSDFLYYSSLLPPSPPLLPIINYIQCFLLCLSTQMQRISVLFTFYHPLFLSFFPLVFSSSPTIANMFSHSLSLSVYVCTYTCMYTHIHTVFACMLLDIYLLDLSSTYEKKHVISVSLNLANLA
jgi:hypothetical protein